ncbi:hypothetical protein FACS1894120_2890 [Clostridia bacterium]|nr:hypothetical protein FACS1894120_2890 [Clostridia bacterium]
MQVIIGTFTELEAVVMPVRYEVFCEEQGVLREIEHDGYDAGAVHCAVEINGAVVGTARFVNIDGTYFVGRVAVLKSERGKGYGKIAVTALLEYAGEHNISEIHIHSQVSAADFYRKLGFTEFGERFSEAGIEHISMKFTPIDYNITADNRCTVLTHSRHRHISNAVLQSSRA